MVIVTLLALLTIAQCIWCHFTLWWLICFICRILFSLRMIGVTFKVKKLAIMEGVALGCMLVWNMLFAGDAGMPWVRIGLTVLFSGASIFLEWLDDLLYVYVIEDVDED